MEQGTRDRTGLCGVNTDTVMLNIIKFKESVQCPVLHVCGKLKFTSYKCN